jgi:hypothetical protein
MSSHSFKRRKPVRVGSNAQVVVASPLHGVPWGVLVFVVVVEPAFGKATVLIDEKLKTLSLNGLTGIESEADIFTKKEWKLSEECLKLECHAAACAAIEALE